MSAKSSIVIISLQAYKDYEGRLVKMNRRLEKIREKFPPSDDMEMSDDDNNEMWLQFLYFFYLCNTFT